MANIASGTNGTCNWVIDANGKLTISPQSGSSGILRARNYLKYLSDCCWDWHDYVDKITSATFSGEITIGGAYSEYTNYYGGTDEITITDDIIMSRMFFGCKNLESVDFGNLIANNISDVSSLFYKCSKLITVDLSEISSSLSDCYYAYLFLGCDLLTTIILGNHFGFKNKSKSNYYLGYPYLAPAKNNTNGIIVNTDMAFDNLSLTERSGTWTRGVSSTFSVNAYRSDTSGIADSDGNNVSFKVSWATDTGTTRNFKVYSKLSTESDYGTTPVLTTDFTGNSGNSTVTLSNVNDDAYDYRVEFTDGTNTWIAFPSVDSNVNLIVVDEDGNTTVKGKLTADLTLDQTTLDLYNSLTGGSLAN